jgi:hypothetical protein
MANIANRVEKYNTIGFVGVDSACEVVVIAFRGAEDCPTDNITGNCRAFTDTKNFL